MTKLNSLPDIYAVEVPEGTGGISIRSGVESAVFFYDKFTKRRDKETINLPPGSYEILFQTKQATEEEWKPLVIKDAHYSRSASFNPEYGHYQTSGSRIYYKNYAEPGSIFLENNNALSSGNSLLRSNNLNPDNNYLLLKKI